LEEAIKPNRIVVVRALYISKTNLISRDFAKTK